MNWASWKKRYVCITLNKNGKLIFEPTQGSQVIKHSFYRDSRVATVYFHSWNRLKYTNGNQKLYASIFFTPTHNNEITTIVKELKNKTSSGLVGFSSFLIKKYYIYIFN
jgi:hypothetical protein